MGKTFGTNASATQETPMNSQTTEAQYRKIKKNVDSSVAERKHGVLYNAMPWNLIKQVRLYGYVLDMKRLAATYFVVIALGVLLGFVFKLSVLWILPIVLFCCLFAPTFIRNSYKNKYEKKRFTHVNTYIEQMLYAFKSSKKVLTALEDVRILFPSGPMREVMDATIELIESPTLDGEERSEQDERDVETRALALIEARYPSKYIKQLHRFMLKVENIGGDFDSSVDLLLANRQRWDIRTYDILDERKSKKTEILVSCLATVFLCAVMLYVLPKQVDISQMAPVRAVHVFTIVACIFIYLKADSKLALDLVNPRKQRTPEMVRKDYDRYLNYNPKKEFMQSLCWAIGPIILTIVMILTKHVYIALISGAFALFFLCQHKIGRNLLYKRLCREISEAFPEWLMELALLLQSDNVHVSIFKTMDTALPIMKPELEKFMAAVEKEPDSMEPFLDFFSAFHLDEITTSMQMLYSLCIGAGGDSDEQITNIVERNNIILDRAEKMANTASLASLSFLFFSPILVGMVALMVDMTLFLIQFMGVMLQTV